MYIQFRKMFIGFSFLFFPADSPGQPTSLLANTVGSTWVYLNWVQPRYIGLQGISSYTVTVLDVTKARDVSTPDNTTMLNVTELLPATSHIFVVRAVSLVLGVKVTSQVSEMIHATTQIAGENSLVCLTVGLCDSKRYIAN